MATPSAVKVSERRARGAAQHHDRCRHQRHHPCCHHRAPARWVQGWWSAAQALPSPNFGPRPAGVVVDLAVIHSISLPPGRFGTGAVEQLFLNQLDCNAHPYFQRLQDLKVSSHFFIRRQGGLLQFVSCDARAWHAGPSQWRGRDNCNDFSIGIELEGLEGGRFEAAQYRQLGRLLRALQARWPLAQAVGHEHVAPGRKADPGPGFDWARLGHTLRGCRLALPHKTWLLSPFARQGRSPPQALHAKPEKALASARPA